MNRLTTLLLLSAILCGACATTNDAERMRRQACDLAEGYKADGAFAKIEVSEPDLVNAYVGKGFMALSASRKEEALKAVALCYLINVEDEGHAGYVMVYEQETGETIEAFLFRKKENR